MITDEYLPQPFRFLNQIVRQVVEDSIEQAMVREISLTKVKRLRVTREMVSVPLTIDPVLLPSAANHKNNQNSNNNNNGAKAAAASDDDETDVEAAEEKSFATAAGDDNGDNNNNQTKKATKSIVPVTASKQQQQQNALQAKSSSSNPFVTSLNNLITANDPLNGQSFFASPVLTVTGSAGAALLINRATGQFTAIDQVFPDDDEDEGLQQQQQDENDDEEQDSTSSNGGAEKLNGPNTAAATRKPTSGLLNLVRSPIPGTAGDVTQIQVLGSQSLLNNEKNPLALFLQQQQFQLQQQGINPSGNNNRNDATREGGGGAANAKKQQPTTPALAKASSLPQFLQQEGTNVAGSNISGNLFKNVVGGLPLIPGEEVSAVALCESSGALLIATAVTRPQIAAAWWQQQTQLQQQQADAVLTQHHQLQQQQGATVAAAAFGGKDALNNNNTNNSNSNTPFAANTPIPTMAITPTPSQSQQQQQNNNSSNANQNQLPLLSTTGAASNSFLFQQQVNATANAENILQKQIQCFQIPSTLSSQSAAGGCGRLLIYSSVVPTASEILSTGGVSAPRRCGIRRLLGLALDSSSSSSATAKGNDVNQQQQQQQPDYAVYLPPYFIAGSIQISPDEDYVSVSSAPVSSTFFSNMALAVSDHPAFSPSSPIGSNASPTKEGNNNNNQDDGGSPGNNNYQASSTDPASSNYSFKPQVLLYRKVKPQDGFSRDLMSINNNNSSANTTNNNNVTSVGGAIAGAVTSSTSAANNTNNAGMLNNAVSSNNNGTANLTNAPLPAALPPSLSSGSVGGPRNLSIPSCCETTLVYLGTFSPPTHALQATSVSPNAITANPHFLFRTVESRYANEINTSNNNHIVASHTLFIAWRGCNCFTTVSLQNHPSDFGGVDVMKGNIVDYVNFANVAIKNALVVSTPFVPANPNATIAGRNNNNNAKFGVAAQQNSSSSNSIARKVVPPLPPLIPIFNSYAPIHILAAQQQQFSQQIAAINTNNNTNVFLPKATGRDKDSNAQQQQQDVATLKLLNDDNININFGALISHPLSDCDDTVSNSSAVTRTISPLVKHRSLPQLITATSVCFRSGRVAVGMADGVIGVWTHGEPPCFTTITVAAPHRSDGIIVNTNPTPATTTSQQKQNQQAPSAPPPSSFAAPQVREKSHRPMIVTSLSFFRSTHLVASIAVPVQIKPVDDLPSVHYSRVVVVELATGIIVASVPHVPALAFATTLGDTLPFILLFGGGRTFWIASIYTGELLVEIPTLSSSTTPAILTSLGIPQTISGDELMLFCSNLSKSFTCCPITGTLYGMFGTGCINNSVSEGNGNNNNNNNKRESQNGEDGVLSSLLLRIDGISIAASIRPLLNRRDDVVRARRSLSDVSELLDSVLFDNNQQERNNNNNDGEMKIQFYNSLTHNDGTDDKNMKHKNKVSPLSSARSVAVAGGGSVATRSVAFNVNNNNNNSIRLGASMAVSVSNMTVGAATKTNNNGLTASQFGGTTGGNNFGASGSTVYLHHQNGSAPSLPLPSNELVSLPLGDVSRKLMTGRNERAKKVNKLLDDLLVSVSGKGNGIIAK